MKLRTTLKLIRYSRCIGFPKDHLSNILLLSIFYHSVVSMDNLLSGSIHGSRKISCQSPRTGTKSSSIFSPLNKNQYFFISSTRQFIQASTSLKVGILFGGCRSWCAIRLSVKSSNFLPNAFKVFRSCLTPTVSI